MMMLISVGMKTTEKQEQQEQSLYHQTGKK